MVIINTDGDYRYFAGRNCGVPRNEGSGPMREDVTPVGLTEIAQRLNVARPTTDQWRIREILPEPEWTVGGRPAWSWGRIKLWAIETGREQGYIYAQADGRCHGLIAAGDRRGGTVWVETWLALTEPPLQWIHDELKIRSSMWTGSAGPSIFRVPRVEWEKRMERPSRRNLASNSGRVCEVCGVQFFAESNLPISSLIEPAQMVNAGRMTIFAGRYLVHMCADGTYGSR